MTENILIDKSDDAAVVADDVNSSETNEIKQESEIETEKKDDTFFAIIAQTEAKELSNILKKRLNISKIKKTDSLKRMVYATTNYPDIDFVFVDFDLFRDKSLYMLEKVKLHTNCKNIKFVLLGTNSTKSLLIKAATAGYSAYLSKPFDEDIVVERISKLLPKQETPNTRLSLLENVEAILQYKNQEAVGSIEDIGVDGCLISIPYFDRLKIEVYDILTIRVCVEGERFGVNAEVTKVEQQDKIGYKAVGISLRFTTPDHSTALEFAKLWAYVLQD